MDQNTQAFEGFLNQHLMDELQDYAIFMLDNDGVIQTWNAGVKNVIGYEESEFIGQHFSLIFTPEDNSVGLPKAELSKADSEGRAQDERWHRKKNGREFWASGLLTRINDETGTPIGYAKIIRDQTKDKLLEEELVKQSNALATANRELANYAGVVSHDLNAPLQTIYGFANELRRSESINDDAKESLEYIAKGAEKMLGLVTQLLQESTQVAQPDSALIETDAVLQEVLLNLGSLIQETGAKVTNDNLSPVWCGKTTLSRMLQNILENAMKYRATGRAPEIHVSTETKGDGVILKIADNGMGVPLEMRERIFTKFFQSNTTQGGKGIGLAVCKEMMENLGGHISAKNNSPHGTIFELFFPTHPEASRRNKCTSPQQ